MKPFFLIITIILFQLNSKVSFSQDFISFRNTVNEANYWFYEGNYDSAMVYYTKAEKFKLPFYPEEVHLFSRTLWEFGDEKKSITILKSGGIKDLFLHDTTYYKGLVYEKRNKIASHLKQLEVDLLPKDIVFYENLSKMGQIYRSILYKYSKDSLQLDSVLNLMHQQDSLNFNALINKIKVDGYPGGYKITPIGVGSVLLHANINWLLNSYSILLNEIENGRMNYQDFSQAIDGIYIQNKQQSPYNSYFPLEEAEVDSPSLVFINRCLIGMSPYYDASYLRLYPRGITPSKSKLYEYYKRSKQNFNCSKIK